MNSIMANLLQLSLVAVVGGGIAPSACNNTRAFAAQRHLVESLVENVILISVLLEIIRDSWSLDPQTKVTLSTVRQHGHDNMAWAHFHGDLRCGNDIGTGGNADQKSFFAA